MCKYYELNKFSDHTINEVYLKLRDDLLKRNNGEEYNDIVKTWTEKAKENRKAEDRATFIESACMYLLLAQNLERTVNKSDRTSCQVYDILRWYHFAANEFRRIDYLEGAGRCYFNSALQAFDATKEIGRLSDSDKNSIDDIIRLGLRSAGRAKGLFTTLGEEDKTDNAHILQRDIQKNSYRFDIKSTFSSLLLLPIFWVWSFTTGYGTKPLRWFGTLAFVIGLFILIYFTLMIWDEIKLFNGLPKTCFTAFFLSIINLFSFGAYTNITPQNWLGQIAIIIHALIAFVLLGTGVTFFTKR